MLQAANADQASEFLRHMEQSVEVYEDLARLTDQTYRNSNDLMGRHWKREGLDEFRQDLTAQKNWLDTLHVTGLGSEMNKRIKN
jgi:hypothetical protein